MTNTIRTVEPTPAPHSPGPRRRAASGIRRAAVLAMWVLGVYLVGRAVAEPFVIDLNDPTTYRSDWGGPSLAGVLAVHCGFGLVALAFLATSARRRFGRRAHGRPHAGGSR